MRVAILSSEAVPFAKTGGLGDVAGALPKALQEATPTNVILIMPLYGETDRRLLGSKFIDNLEVEWFSDEASRIVQVWYSEAAGFPAYLIESPHDFTRPNVYGYADDHLRFAFFCRASLALLRRLNDEAPDVIHLNDWPCGFAAVELSRARRVGDPFFAATRTLFSIHNLAYQGIFDPRELNRLGFVAEEDRDSFMLNGAASALKAGLLVSDALSTVSRRYAIEIQTPEYGSGLDWLLSARRDRLIGITNGVDYTAWDPVIDPHIAAPFSEADLSGKAICKRDLLRRFGLPEETNRPVIASISRLVAQKGYDLIREAADAILASGAFFVALGSGAEEYERFLQAWHNAAPSQVGIYLGFNEALAHQIEAGADIFLMPSLYEPCGLNQMYSMRYGTVPVVRATGGLDDTVEHFSSQGTGNGFKFEDYATHRMLECLHEALYYYEDAETWHRIRLAGMRTDNSWQRAAHRYIEIYDTISH